MGSILKFLSVLGRKVVVVGRLGASGCGGGGQDGGAESTFRQERAVLP